MDVLASRDIVRTTTTTTTITTTINNNQQQSTAINNNKTINNNQQQQHQQQSTGRIIAASKSYPGSENDKTIILPDKSIWRIQNEEPWKSYKYSLYNADGSATNYKGASVVVDRVYPKVKA